MSIDSTINIPSRIKANKQNFAFGDILSERFNEIQNEKQNIFNENQANLLEGFSTKRKSSRKKIKHETYNMQSEILAEGFANIIYKSVPIDAKPKKLLESYITETAKNAFKKLMNEGKLLEGNNQYELYNESFESCAVDIADIDCQDKKKLIERIMEVKNNINLELENLLTSVLRDKVSSTIINEKSLVNKKEKLMQENKHFNGRSLFSTINYSIYHNLKNESAILAENRESLYDNALNILTNAYDKDGVLNIAIFGPEDGKNAFINKDKNNAVLALFNLDKNDTNRNSIIGEAERLANLVVTKINDENLTTKVTTNKDFATIDIIYNEPIKSESTLSPYSCLEEEALTKTVVFYTILEGFNTFGLCNFEREEIKDDMNSIYNKTLFS